MRLGWAALDVEDSDVVFVKEGNEGTAEPEERGWDTQSSERESSHAPSMANRMLDADY